MVYLLFHVSFAGVRREQDRDHAEKEDQAGDAADVGMVALEDRLQGRCQEDGGRGACSQEQPQLQVVVIVVVLLFALAVAAVPRVVPLVAAKGANAIVTSSAGIGVVRAVAWGRAIVWSRGRGRGRR